MKELAPKFNHKEVEEGQYIKWLEKQLFYTDLENDKPKYTIVLPPPNVTGKLHLGHALNGTLQDVLIRYHKMNGYDALWIPGMDHAGIATQAKVEERLREQGISRYDLGREKFIEKAFEWKEEYAQHIRDEWASLGLALDYSKEVFTLDPNVKEAVKYVFVKMYEQGKIYKGSRIINWDPVAQTAISDIEVIHEEIPGREHYFKYVSAENPEEYLEIMTTRPETMFGDGALAVHPEDTRYNHLEGKEYIIPNTDRTVRLILDEYVDKDKGSGVVKITVAHDPNDYHVGMRHKLEPIIIMDKDGTMMKNEYVPKDFQGLDRVEARKLQIAKAEQNNLLIKLKDIMHSVGHSERTKAIIEPYYSSQWFVKMDELAQESLAFQQTDDKIKFHPERFETNFTRWMEDVHDWCISRQLWWGHEIPAWTHKETGELYVGMEAPKDEENWIQDPDVLDTWFSSALWPFLLTGWRHNEEMFNKLYPTAELITAYDIIFFWVSRMVFQGLEFTDKKPFNNVLIHGLIRAEDGRKMSKSLGNGVFPNDVIELYGADALRYFLVSAASPGNDLRYSEEKLKAAWNFNNKLWNITRYVNQVASEVDLLYITPAKIRENLNSVDYWILDNLNKTLEQMQGQIKRYEFNELILTINDFAREKFANWYIETSKIILNDESVSADEKTKTKSLLKYILGEIIKMLHPFTPFITTKLYQALTSEETEVYTVEYPKQHEIKGNTNFDYLIDIVTTIRNFKAENKIKPSQELKIKVLSKLEYNELEISVINNLAKVKTTLVDSAPTESSITKVLNEQTIYISEEGLFNEEEKIVELTEDFAKLSKELMRSVKMLSNQNFVAKATSEKLADEKLKARGYLEQHLKLEKALMVYGQKIDNSLYLQLEEIINKL